MFGAELVTRDWQVGSPVFDSGLPCRRAPPRKSCSHPDMNRKTDRLIEKLFEDRSESFRLFHLVNDFVHSLGPVDVVVTKTQVAFGRKRRFAWVWLPQMWIRKQPGDSITLTFGLDHRIRDLAIKESLEPYPGRFTHHVVITKAKDFNIRIRDWLREAYEQAGQSRRGAKSG